MLKAIAPGSGAISFDPTPGANEYAANETGFNYAPLNTNGNLSFTIGQACRTRAVLHLHACHWRSGYRAPTSRPEAGGRLIRSPTLPYEGRVAGWLVER